MDSEKKTIWIVSREYAGIAEAGGVKNVTTSLAESLIHNGYAVKVFIPEYGCCDYKSIQKYTSLDNFSVDISIADELFTVHYAKALAGKVTILFIKNHIFSSKTAVYTYTSLDEKLNPLHRRGLGHIDNDTMNAVFQRAVLEYALLQQEVPHIIHCQDAAASLVPVYAREDIRIKKVFKHTACIVTIHNAGPGYHHAFNSIEDAYRITNLPHHVLMYGLNGQLIEPFLLASKYAVLTTVSPWYAQEITSAHYPYTDGLSHQFALRNTQVIGILNGIDYERYDPTNTEKSLLCASYNPMKGDFEGKKLIRNCLLKKLQEGIIPLQDHKASISVPEQFGSLHAISQNPIIFGYHGRIVWQKGLEILVCAARRLLMQCSDACFLIIGQGQPEIEQMHIELSREFDGRYVYIRGYERALARECIASSDFLVLPSVFEPCGLEDYIGQIFGTLPIAHAVGGLQKILHEKTGFLYTDNSPETLFETLKFVVSIFFEQNQTIQIMRKNAARRVYEKCTWKTIVQDSYIPLYEKIIFNNRLSLAFF